MSAGWRSACSAITGVMKMTPTATKVLLELTALHVMTATEVQEGIYRLMCNQEWRPKSINFDHAKKSRDMEHDTEICISQAGYSQVHKQERMAERVLHRQ
jgi:hypothetical protein